ncbi:ectoine synthase [Actinopolyspora mortivallis]|uniref:ectoine synthase n=1 Tax=Actinopolyspora mortivallis TaxID=33906 RepID=UPI00037B743C|nr:ectoine synthase [Actinopolyspora mortivallis]
MFVRSSYEVPGVEWGNGNSYRLLVESDGMGFAVAHTVVEAGTESRMQYTRHLEACYCISGKGEIRSADEDLAFSLEPGVLYVLDRHDRHVLIAGDEADMHLLSVFNPPIDGTERHVLSPDGFSSY